MLEAHGESVTRSFRGGRRACFATRDDSLNLELQSERFGRPAGHSGLPIFHDLDTR